MNFFLKLTIVWRKFQASMHKKTKKWRGNYRLLSVINTIKMKNVLINIAVLNTTTIFFGSKTD
jgi:hypothetical protein